MLTLLLIITAALGSEPPTQSLDAVVSLYQGDTFCSGFFIDESALVVTSYHCVASGGRTRVENRKGEGGVGRVIAASRANDLALIETEGFEGQPFLQISESEPTIGEDVWALGHPYGSSTLSLFMSGTLLWSITSGEISAIGDRAIQFTAPINPGNSGGPVVNGEGAVVGVVSRRLAGDGLGFASNLEAINQLIEGREPMRPVGGFVRWGLDSRYLSVVEAVPTLGFRVQAEVRDRAIVSVGTGWPLGARWATFSYEDAMWTDMEARAGLRQRVGQGPFTMRVDVTGGATRINKMILQEGQYFMTERQWAPVVAAELSSGFSALEYAWVEINGEWTARVGLHLKLSGPLSLF